MRRIADAAAARLANAVTDEPITNEEMVRLLARIARTGPPAARLRAIELLGTGIGLFSCSPDTGAVGALSDEERLQRLTAILERARMRRQVAQGGANA